MELFKNSSNYSFWAKMRPSLRGHCFCIAFVSKFWLSMCVFVLYTITETMAFLAQVSTLRPIVLLYKF